MPELPAAGVGGPIALVGSGEYLRQMEDVDRLLLEHVGGASARVVVLATAAGLEPPVSPQRWTRMGVEHFARLGARAEPVGILVRDDAFDPQWLPLLEAADFIYFSGGSPQHLIQTMETRRPGMSSVPATRPGRHWPGAVPGRWHLARLTLQPRTLWRRGSGDGERAELVPGTRIARASDRAAALRSHGRRAWVRKRWRCWRRRCPRA